MGLNCLQAVKSGFCRHRHKRTLPLYALPENSKVLDISCGDGNLLAQMRAYRPSLLVYGVDISEAAITQAGQNCPSGNFVRAAAEHLPYGDGEFDAVISCMSLHHYAEPAQVFKEIFRVLSPNGKFYLVDFIAHNRWSQLINNWCGCEDECHFEKYYTRKDVEFMAARFGFFIPDEFKLGFLSGRRFFVLDKLATTINY